MPEGDTIYRTAKTLGDALEGHSLITLRSPVLDLEPEQIREASVLSVRARGKNLLIHIGTAEGEQVLYTHLRMNGSWHLYPSGVEWRKPASQARVVLETARNAAVCFNAPVVEWLRPEAVDRHPHLRRLGPDLLDPRCDLAEAIHRVRERSDRTIGETLLVQAAVAGIGNVYKSEVLFLCGVSPARSVGELDHDQLRRLLERARDLMRRNLEGGPRVTRRDRRGERLWVYGRSGRPCYRCGETIRQERQGLGHRSTYWCPGCQAS